MKNQLESEWKTDRKKEESARIWMEEKGKNVKKQC